MSRLDIMTPSHAQTVIDGLYRDVERRIAASPPGLCPVDLAKSFLDLCHAQTCGKCVPCRIGLGQLSELMEQVLEGEATMETISIIERVARVIVNSADCAIGRDAARLVLDGVQGFRDDYEEHILRHRCLGGMREPVPCVALCPAGVDIPGYLVLIKYGRYADAVRLIRKDNPFPSACAYICEHPCEARCRRNMIDDAVNIRGLKRYAVDNAGYVPQPDCAEPTGKKVAVIGGGPSGLSAAYYLALMGHKVTVYEKCAKLGGMLRYGIPNYRLPREVLDAEIASMLALGIDVHVNVNVGDDVTFDELRQQNDALYIALGAHTDKKTGIEGEDAEGVISAVEMLREIGDDHMPDFRNKDIVVIGGGNVAMDVCRSAVRLGARKVSCVYRRRQEDMTALPEEVEGAVAEGVELVTLQAPVRIETDANGHAVALWTQPQIIGEMDKKGRPAPEKAKRSEKRIAADVVVVAIGQGVETHGFEQTKIAIKRGAFVAEASGQIDNMDGVFAGGDCVTGPATVIRAIAAGKVAAANIDEYLGFHHEIDPGVEIPTARLNNKPPHGRIDTTEREAGERKHDFKCIECGLTDEEAYSEASRCLRCIQVCENVQSVKIWDLLGTGSRTVVDASYNRRIQDTECTYCGQCITHCPTAALRERDDTGLVFDAIDDPNTVTVAQVAPAVRAAWAEQFGLDSEFATPKRMVAALRELGFNYVFDTDFAADLTIMEEGSEFIERFTHKDQYQWPMFTSCCPGWVRFVKSQYPELTDNLSTAKSPQQMFGAVAKSYFAEKVGIDPKRLFVVSIMPCVSKKSECALPTMKNDAGDPDVDVSITTRELNIMMRANHIEPKYLPEEEFDSPLGSATGAAVVFGTTGGVMDAALRSAYFLVTGKNPDPDAFTAVRGMDGWKEATFNIPGAGDVRVAVVSSLGKARKLIEAVKRGDAAYDFVEVMACPGGCAGGGGQPIHDGTELAEDRGNVLWRLDQGELLRFSHENPDVKALYKDYLGAPLGEKSHHLLHTDHNAWQMPQKML